MSEIELGTTVTARLPRGTFVGRVVGKIGADSSAWPRTPESVVVRVADTSEWIEVDADNVRRIDEANA